MRAYTLEIDTELRKQFVVDVLVFKEDRFVFFDETGCDRCDLYRRKGYRGRTPLIISPLRMHSLKSSL